MPEQIVLSAAQVLESEPSLYSSLRRMRADPKAFCLSPPTRFSPNPPAFNRNTAYNANDYFTKRAGQARPKFDLNEFGGNLGGPLWIPHVYNTNRNRTFFFWNEEWRRLVQGSAPSVQNAIMADNFPTAGQDLAYTIPTGGARGVSGGREWHWSCA